MIDKIPKIKAISFLLLQVIVGSISFLMAKLIYVRNHNIYVEHLLFVRGLISSLTLIMYNHDNLMNLVRNNITEEHFKMLLIQIVF